MLIERYSDIDRDDVHHKRFDAKFESNGKKITDIDWFEFSKEIEKYT